MCSTTIACFPELANSPTDTDNNHSVYHMAYTRYMNDKHKHNGENIRHFI